MRYFKLMLGVLLLVGMFFGCASQPVAEEPEVIVEDTTTVVEEPVKPELVLNRIFFDFDKSDIRPEAAEVLSANAEMLGIYPDVNIVIEGHCCRIGTAEYNMALGERRAKAAYDYLVNLGISESRLSTISYGEERPLNPDVLEQNRRCEFVVK
jgi:outer membrane protein OmpA-like peptidoglycan-associated protein